MARCSYHPAIETEMRCAECGKPICPKEMVLTPVGYKCPEDARLLPGQYRYMKPKQAALALGAGVAASIAIAMLGATSGFRGLFMGILWGAAVAEVVRRASGGHRGATVGSIAAGSVAAGWAASIPAGGVSPLVAVVAAAMAFAQLSVNSR